MASTVEICNRALQKLGARTIVSLLDDSPNARACNLAYEPVRLSLLRKHVWNFAIKRAELAEDATPPAFGPASSYALPADWLRLLPPDAISNIDGIDWVIEGKKILTNDSAPLQIRYISDVTDPNEMDVNFRELLSTELAFEICEELTQSNSKKEALRSDAKTILLEARRNNAIEKPPTESADDSWVNVRR